VRLVPRGQLEVNGGLQLGTRNFKTSGTIRVNAEDGTYATEHVLKSGVMLNVNGGYTLWKQMGVGVGIAKFSTTTPASLNGAVPHPFFFNKPRPVAGPVSGLSRDELAIHLQARLVTPVTPRLQLTLFGGPSFFQVRQGLVSAFTWKDEYPYDQATLATTQTASGSSSTLGFNAGGDVAFFLGRALGVGGSLQISRASLDLTSGNAHATIGAGGVQAGGGLRLRF
jgi:hypothetical protein